MSIIIYFLWVNSLAYILMWRDKKSAKAKQWRTSEKLFWLMAIFGGSIDIYLGTRKPLYHKASKMSFIIGIPILILVQVVVMFWIRVTKS